MSSIAAIVVYLEISSMRESGARLRIQEVREGRPSWMWIAYVGLDKFSKGECYPTLCLPPRKCTPDMQAGAGVNWYIDVKGGMFSPCVFLVCQYCSQPVEGGFELLNESILFPCRAYALFFLCTHVSSSVLFIALSYYNLHWLECSASMYVYHVVMVTGWFVWLA